MHSMKFTGATTFLVGALFLLPASADAAVKSRSFEISGWIPYWRTATGTADTAPHLDVLTEINPFGYSVTNDGQLRDTALLQGSWQATTTVPGTTTVLVASPWDSFLQMARAKNLRIIPTVMWSNREAMEQILNNGPKRRALADEITKIVRENNYDGIDIDFEGKSAETRIGYSTFLKALDLRMPDKWIMCTIESRTPLEDRYYGVEIPPDATKYANDLKEINKYCDRVKIMAYDQQGIDLKLAAQAASSSQLYAPVGDPAWVEKVVRLMSKDIAKNKIMIGVPTYGYEYDVTAYAGNQYLYDILWTFNPGYALPIAQQYGITPERGIAGELYFTYTPTGGTTTPPAAPVGAGVAAAAASQFAQAYNSNLKFRMLTWPDEVSIEQKIDLARRLGVRGIAIFKFDGGQDPDIWKDLEANSVPWSPALTGSFNRALSIGSVGNDVKLLQQLLNSDPDTQITANGGGSPGQETTRFGTLTQRALEKFQVKNGIAKKGQSGFGSFGPKTRAKANELLAR